MTCQCMYAQQYALPDKLTWFYYIPLLKTFESFHCNVSLGLCVNQIRKKKKIVKPKDSAMCKNDKGKSLCMTLHLKSTQRSSYF